MNSFGNIKNVYFIGIGGIGMSSLARYFLAGKKRVAGYDRTPTPLTRDLELEGMAIHYTDNPSLIEPAFLQSDNTLVVYTPAVPSYHRELSVFRERNFNIMKRSEVLGAILKEQKGIAVAGTHGKTTVSSMIAHLLHSSGVPCNAFLGGISKNLGSNLLLSHRPEFTVVEADEFDRSFLTLFPYAAVVTAMDADHLDIYGNQQALVDSFNRFVSQIVPGGILVYKKGIPVVLPEGIRTYSYSASEKADFHLASYTIKGFKSMFSLHTPSGEIKNLCLGVYGKVNVENAIAGAAIALLSGVPEGKIRKALEEFSGVSRRFDVRKENEKIIYIDDYAHHPEELKAFILSVREATPGRRLTGVFQPHLFSRTRDFAEGFSQSLSLLDDVVLLDIYPAREEPIPGVDSGIIFNKLENKGARILCSKKQALEETGKLKPEVLLSMGAGDIDQLVPGFENLLNRLYP